MKKLLCKPCAMGLEARGKTVKPAGGRSEKITCAECDRRRFGVLYDVTGRLFRRKKEDTTIGVGTCTLGRRQTDKDGNVVSQTPARWEADPAGGSVAIVPLNQDTMQPDGPAEIFGDWDAARYLARVVELIHPNRRINVPDLEAMIRRAAMDGLDLCEYCQDPYMCRDCIVKEWKEDPGGE